ncbi:MAG: rod shape-determining protein [Candidatus Buchananbacteria bacterium RIFCSPHIGHO2_01_FULL_39_14]|uniref:Cell shape-determining protein MreB n=2 Tax=Candidatus Buchananiibacteriota TaxID=1817903 RepID=A0A1G1YPT2_9BACT|nr:MAG: rod shape-determining protein [Candidatus Buchananbacteria bacterium RIFCSPHIGHO2_01_FULL_39_14]OGY48853.1 MAG: rod shape-determining protein [Candidatus Buchananbacteria bacterium RIFCSPHIGHO2_02_FULL_39_17]OGY54373.1 MAG: rod shape-determining protein [Candidatus Buchananbacteria bacterium RIFCSPLOWO2_01_FULL_40_23b]
MFKNLFKKFAKDVAIDLGTSNTLIYVKDRGIVVKESSIVAINNRSGQILAVGEEAQKMVGKTPPHLTISKPLVDGIISDFEVTEKMLKYFIDRIYQESFGLSPRPRVVIGVPLDVTEVEKKAVEDVVLSAGAREVFLVENVIATAIGARLPIQDPSGNMVVDLGGGITEIAVISLSGVVAWKSLRTAGNKLNQDIIQFARSEFNLLIGERVAEEIKIAASRLIDSAEPIELKMRGRDLITGLPKEVIINTDQVRLALQRSIAAIVEGIKSTLEITPPELVADIYQRGIILAGGGALLTGLDQIIAKVTKIPVKVIDDSLTCAVRGMGLILDDENLLREVAIPSSNQDDKTSR